jgi:hypothetical protein
MKKNKSATASGSTGQGNHRKEEMSKGHWFIILLVLAFAIWALTNVAKDEPTTRTEVAYAEPKHEVFALVNYSYRPINEFKCESFAWELHINFTRFDVRLLDFLDRETHYSENSNSRYRISMPEIRIWKDAITNNEEFQSFVKDADNQRADWITCWAYILSHEIGLTVTYYDEGYAEGPMSITEYERVVYNCNKNDGEDKWDCEWTNDGFDRIDIYSIEQDIRNAIISEVTNDDAR